MTEVFYLENVTFKYNGNLLALENISFSVYEKEIFFIIGSNGSGKTTLLNVLSGLIFPQFGILKYRSEIINEKTLKDKKKNIWFRSSIGYVFQDSDDQLFCPSVVDELLFGPLQIGLSKEESYHRAIEILKLLNIEHIKERPVYMLSGGEKKKVAIGAILTMNPDVLIFDEPLSGLDPRSRSSIIEIIFKLNEIGKTIIITTHHLDLVALFQSRVAVLSEDHKIAAIGNYNEILSDTDLLIKNNLIDEFPHRHDNIIHKHITDSFIFYRHNHE